MNDNQNYVKYVYIIDLMNKTGIYIYICMCVCVCVCVCVCSNK
jgi:hypothetical protein